MMRDREILEKILEDYNNYGCLNTEPNMDLVLKGIKSSTERCLEFIEELTQRKATLENYKSLSNYIDNESNREEYDKYVNIIDNCRVNLEHLMSGNAVKLRIRNTDKILNEGSILTISFLLRSYLINYDVESSDNYLAFSRHNIEKNSSSSTIANFNTDIIYNVIKFVGSDRVMLYALSESLIMFRIKAGTPIRKIISAIKTTIALNAIDTKFGLGYSSRPMTAFLDAGFRKDKVYGIGTDDDTIINNITKKMNIKESLKEGN